MNANQNFLSVENLSVNFNLFRGTENTTIYAVRNVSFTMEKGEILGIVGESGSGKSVTTSSIAGLLPKNAQVEGKIFFEGTDLLSLFNLSRSKTKLKKNATEQLRLFRGKKIGMIFQEPGRAFDPLQNMFSVFFETFRNKDNKITKEQAYQKAVQLLTETGIDRAEERLQNFPHQFSGGQLQRIGIALALAQDCELLIADEPTTALDVTIQKQIIELLLDLRKKRNISIIFISHNIDLVAEISDRIMVMYGGMIMEVGNWQQIYKNPKHPYTKALLSVSPAFGSHYSTNPLSPIPGKVTDPANPEPGCPFYPRCFFVKKSQNECLSCRETLPELLSVTEENKEQFVRCALFNCSELKEVNQ